MEEKYRSVGISDIDEPICHRKYAAQAIKGIVELGILSGYTTKILLESSHVTVYGIDPIIPDSMDENLIGDINRIHELQNNYDRFAFIKDYSYNVAPTWNKEFDYLFIDANHHYESVKNDFECWFTLLSEGGVVSLHDSAANRGGPHWWEGPSKLADNLINDPRVEYLETIGTMTVFRKIAL